MAITIQTEGQRLYFAGDTYQAKDRLRAAGAHWDGDRMMWWIGVAKRAEADALLAELAAAPARPAQATPRDEAPGEQARVRARVTYKGRAYYSLWEGDTRRGRAHKLVFRDGSKVFWASAEEVQVERRYGRENHGRVEYPTIASLRAYAERRAREAQTGECECRCHAEPNAGAPGTTLYDGCSRCGCESC